VTKKSKSTKQEPKPITAEEMDKRFDAGASILEYADLDTAVFRVNVDFPAWAVAELDRESNRLGVSRQSLIKIWITERLDQLAKERRKIG
jgi:hypothetical protein